MQKAAIQNLNIAYGYRTADDILRSAILHNHHRRLVACLMKMKNHAHHEKAKSTVMKQVVKIRWVKQFRGYFEKWRKTAELMEVSATCHEAGVVRQEKNKFDQ